MNKYRTEYQDALFKQGDRHRNLKAKTDELLDYVEKNYESMPNELQGVFSEICTLSEQISDGREKYEELHKKAIELENAS